MQLYNCNNPPKFQDFQRSAMAAQPEPIGRWYWCSDGNTWHNYDHGVCKILEQAMKLDMSRVYVDTGLYNILYVHSL